MDLKRRKFVAAVATASVGGCTTAFDGEANGRLDLTVGNKRGEPVSVRIEVVDDDGTRYEEESDRIDGGVARAFEVVVGSSGRHEATVSGEDWRGQLAWNASVCARFEGTVRVTDESIEVEGECTEQR